jgi:tRNA A-37 threonylcarbamoyl transferase component Bud32
VTTNGLIEVKPHAWITLNRFFLSSDRRLIVKYHCSKPRDFRFFKYRALWLVGFPAPFEYRSERARCAHEREVYAHWHALRYNVPRLIEPAPVTLPGPAEQCLTLEYIDGEALSEILTSPTVPLERKLPLVAALFAGCNARHAAVLEKHDRLLIKYDANLRNIIVKDDRLFDIDFECGRIAESLPRGAAREISRYAVETIKALGREHCSAVVGLLRREYRHPDILDRVTKDGARQRQSSEFSRHDLARQLAQG